MAWGRGKAAAAVLEADSGAVAALAYAGRRRGVGRRLGWASARSGAAQFFFKTFRRKIRRKINKNPKKIKQIFPV